LCRSRGDEALTEKSDVTSRKLDQSLLTSTPTDFKNELQRLVAGAEQAHALGLKVNAGHGLNYENLPALCSVPHLVELNIGHSIVSRAVTVGLDQAVKEMLTLMKGYR